MDLTTSNDESRNPASDGKKLIRMIIFPVLAVLIAILLTWIFCMFRNGQWGVMSREFLFAAVLSIIATLAGSAVLSATWHYRPDYLPQAVMGAMGIKLFITLIGFVIFALIFKPIRLEFVVYMAIFYLTGLVGETVIAIKMTRRMNDSSGPADEMQK
jgi:hypothetical protein